MLMFNGAFFVLLLVIVCVTILLVASMHYSAKTRLEAHKSLQQALASNLEITPELLNALGDQNQKSKDLRRGVMLLATSVPLAYFLVSSGEFNWEIALIPFALGVTYIALALLFDRR